MKRQLINLPLPAFSQIMSFVKHSVLWPEYRESVLSCQVSISTCQQIKTAARRHPGIVMLLLSLATRQARRESSYRGNTQKCGLPILTLQDVLYGSIRRRLSKHSTRMEHFSWIPLLYRKTNGTIIAMMPVKVTTMMKRL